MNKSIKRIRYYDKALNGNKFRSIQNVQTTGSEVYFVF